MMTSRRKTTTKRSSYGHEFVDILPDRLEDGIVYVSVKYATSAHNCFCGCGREVVTPIHPTKWQLGFDGVSVSLHPSVGNWSLPCKSHYWVQKGRVAWAESWSDEKIGAARMRDLTDQDHYFGGAGETPAAAETPKPKSRWRQFRDWIEGI